MIPFVSKSPHSYLAGRFSMPKDCFDESVRPILACHCIFANGLEVDENVAGNFEHCDRPC